jgi:hypothetical protein
MIFTYALTDTTSYPVDREPAPPQDAQARRDRCLYRNSSQGTLFYPSDIALSLLLTCKAVYLETYTTPLRVNPFIVTRLDAQMMKHDFLPWQLAQITRLEVKLQQMGLEKGALRNALKKWKAQARSQNCYIIPKNALLRGHDAAKKLKDCPRSFDNVLIPATTTQRIDKRPQLISHVLSCAQIPETTAQPCSLNLRVPLANPITHLTLRLTARDWWTWADDPESKGPHQRLRLDPTFGSPQHSQESVNEMNHLAIQRKAGYHPTPHAECWGTHITSLLPDLRVLELVLETFKDKMEQLDNVASCARTWKFDVGEKTLVWDGEVVEKRWQRGMPGLRMPKEAVWDERCINYEVRIVRFVCKRR